MENASKALLIAGGILISIVVISIMAYMFTTGINFAKSYDDTLEITRTAQFNSNFEDYWGRKDLTIHDVVTVINLAKDYNTRIGYDAIKDVEVDRISYLNKTEEQLVQLIQGEQNMYTCKTIQYDPITARVVSIVFQSNS